MHVYRYNINGNKVIMPLYQLCLVCSQCLSLILSCQLQQYFVKRMYGNHCLNLMIQYNLQLIRIGPFQCNLKLSQTAPCQCNPNLMTTAIRMTTVTSSYILHDPDQARCTHRNLSLYYQYLNTIPHKKQSFLSLFFITHLHTISRSRVFSTNS